MPLCFNIWLYKFSLRVNCLLHSSQQYVGFSEIEKLKIKITLEHFGWANQVVQRSKNKVIFSATEAWNEVQQ